MNRKHVAIAFLLIPFLARVTSADLRKIVSIGSTEMNYLFFTVSRAVLDDDHNVYVADSRGSFVRKYDRHGIFVKEVGKFGQGPGDFSDAISGMAIVGSELNVLDGKNRRIAVMDLDLNIQKYIPIRHAAFGLLKIGESYYLLFPGREDPFFRIAVYNNKGDLQKEFLDQRPSYMDKKAGSRTEMGVMRMFSRMHFQFNKNSREIVVIPENPGESIELFFCSPEGEFLRKVNANHLISYRFPFTWDFPLKHPEQDKLIRIESIHCLEDDMILLDYTIVEYKEGKAAGADSYILIIDMKTGKLVHKEPLDPNITIMDVKGKSICCRTDEGDITKVVVYNFDY